MYCTIVAITNVIAASRIPTYLIECVYSDNGTEYKGSANHAFGVACYENGIGQKFTRVARPQTNGKAERVIRTLMEMWHEKQSFESPEHR